MKLDGRDPDQNKRLSVAEQVMYQHVTRLFETFCVSKITNTFQGCQLEITFLCLCAIKPISLTNSLQVCFQSDDLVGLP